MCGSNLRCLRRRVRPWRSTLRRSWARAVASGPRSPRSSPPCARSRPDPTSSPTRSARGPACNVTPLPPETRFVPIPARILLGSWVRSDVPRIDRWLRPAQVVHATNYLAPPGRLPTLVSVYDCSFVRYPELCTPEVRAFDPVIRRAVARGATLHTGSEFVADEIEEIFGPGLRAAGRLVVVPLGIPALGDEARMPDARRRRARWGTVRRGDRHARAPQELRAPRRRVRRGRRPPPRPPPRPRRARRSRPARDRGGDRRACPAGVRERVIMAGSVSDAGRRALLEQRDAARLPVDLRGLRLPRTRGHDRAGPRRGRARRFDPRGRGRRRDPRRAHERTRAGRRDGPRDQRRPPPAPS